MGSTWVKVLLLLQLTSMVIMFKAFPLVSAGGAGGDTISINLGKAKDAISETRRKATHGVNMNGGVEAKKKLHVVQMRGDLKPIEFETHKEWYGSILNTISTTLQNIDQNDNNNVVRADIVHVYETVLHGFTAHLSAEEAEALEAMDGVLSVTEDTVLQLHTTHSPAFLGLEPVYGLLPVSNEGEGVIVGIVDTGIWPESRSFKDDALDLPLPEASGWKGTCAGLPEGSCNNKLVGARRFYAGYEAAFGFVTDKSALDMQGHGTHTASTAAGAYVANASLMGQALGLARGMAPRAHLAIYKACWSLGCVTSDVVAAFDSAVADGVGVISASIGGGVASLERDLIALAAFGAVEKGVVVSMSAGNSGPSPGTVGNVAPWIFTVAADTMDRAFPAPITLADGSTVVGQSLTHDIAFSDVQLVYFPKNSSTSLCIQGSLPSDIVRGKIVICDRGITSRTQKSKAVQVAGGIGMILVNSKNNGNEVVVDSHVIPTVALGYNDGQKIKTYVQETEKALASKIDFLGTTLGVKPAPMIASFSSRGPNILTQDLLKPDVSAPGVNILAAWTHEVGPTSLQDDNRIVDFNILSGTSMSCPHVSGLCSLLKAAHPKWSPSAIKSALMTTASTIDNTFHTISDAFDLTPCNGFCYGAGHVNPNKALNPGLVYDISTQDYVDFLCSMNFDDKMLLPFTKGKYNCSIPKVGVSNLNYPSLAATFSQEGTTKNFKATYSRTLTSVGPIHATYSLNLKAPKNVTVTIIPSHLYFTKRNQKQTFQITIEASPQSIGTNEELVSFGSFTWSYKTYHIYTPIVFTWN